MPKTKAAFWLANFDEEKILQRPYFKKFSLPPLTDTEILSSLEVSEEEDIASMEQKLSTIKALHTAAQNFNNHLLIRYAERLKKIQRQTYIEFLTATMALTELIQSLQQMYYEVEGVIQKCYRKAFTERLRQYRKAAKLTQKELGELVQVSQRGMSNYELGDRDIPSYTLARLSKVLGVTTDELLGLR